MKHPKTYTRTAFTKEKLWRAVIQLSKKKEYEELTIREICREAGVSNGAFYHHYPTKDALVSEAFLTYDNAISEELTDYCDTLSPLNALRFLTQKHLEYIQEQIASAMPAYYRVLLKGQNALYLDENRTFHRIIRRQIQRCLQEKLFPSHLDEDRLTILFTDFFRGCIFNWCLCGQNYNLPEHSMEELEILLCGLLHSPTK